MRVNASASARVKWLLMYQAAASAASTRSLFSSSSLLSHFGNPNSLHKNHSTIIMQNDVTVAHQKRALRSKLRKDLKAMTPSQKSLQDIAIQNFVLEAPWFKSCTSLCAYISCEALREVDTSKILSQVLHAPTTDFDSQSKKKLYVPWVEDKNSHMRMLNISSVEDLVPNSMSILEPSLVDTDGNQRDDVMKATHPVDLFLLPGLAFDRSGRRLGRGGGYYDTFLNEYQKLAAERKWRQPLLVALSYSAQIVEEGIISVTPKDVPVDALVSPDGVIPISPVAKERMVGTI